MENKLSITEIRFIRSLAGKKTDEELADMINKPIALVQMQFSLMSNLPKRPWERGPVIKVPKTPKKEKIRSKSEKPVKEKSIKPKPVKEKPVKKSRAKIGSRRDKQAKKAVKKREVVKVNEAVVNRQKEWKNKNEKRQFKTKSAIKAGTIPYKLNAKTVIWDKPGVNIEQLKKKFNIS